MPVGKLSTDRGDGGEGGAVVGSGGRRQEEEEALEEVDAAEHVVEARVRVERLLERLEPHLCRQRPPRLRLRTTYIYMQYKRDNVHVHKLQTLLGC